MRREDACSIGVERPVNVENCCLLKAPVMMTSGLPPATQIELKTVFRFASEKETCAPSVRVPVPSAEAGSEPVPFLKVLEKIHDTTEAVRRASDDHLAWVLPHRIDSMSRLSSRPLRFIS